MHLAHIWLGLLALLAWEEPRLALTSGGTQLAAHHRTPSAHPQASKPASQRTAIYHLRWLILARSVQRAGVGSTSERWAHSATPPASHGSLIELLPRARVAIAFRVCSHGRAMNYTINQLIIIHRADHPCAFTRSPRRGTTHIVSFTQNGGAGTLDGSGYWGSPQSGDAA